VSATRDVVIEPDLLFMTNITIYDSVKNHRRLQMSDLIKDVLVKEKKNGEKIFKKAVNSEFWEKTLREEVGDSIVNIFIDEFHLICDARNSSSPENREISHWMTLLRKFLMTGNGIRGRAVFITQDINSVDVRFRVLTTQVRYHKCHCMISCEDCGYMEYWNSDMPEKPQKCARCESRHLREYAHRVEIWKFNSWDAAERWQWQGMKTYYAHYYLSGLEKYFRFYDTRQSNTLFEDEA
jgi:hypothetical protein